jgi:hypothetical protein
MYEDEMDVGARGAVMKTFKQFPRGKLNREDEGAVEVAVGIQGDVVVLAFPKPVAWFGMAAEQAEEVAEMIKQRAQEARRNRH